MSSARINSRYNRAIHILEKLGYMPLSFQATLGDRCVCAVEKKEKLLILAPTGSGKTLVGQLSIALIAQEKKDFVRVLAVIPSRPLLSQHVFDASWLSSFDFCSVNVITSEDPFPMVKALLGGPGLVYVNPITLSHRLPIIGGYKALSQFDYVIFDEIDMYLTMELTERKDTWKALENCLQAELPVLGFTGTALTEKQIKRWRGYGFKEILPDIPDDWLPFTQVRFCSISNSDVILADNSISKDLAKAYEQFENEGGDPSKWSEIKEAAKGFDSLAQAARQILKHHSDRLKLFEGVNDIHEKLNQAAELCLHQGPAIVLSRYRISAQRIARVFSDMDIQVIEADGSLPRPIIKKRTQTFRSEANNDNLVLVITRQLGGRGLDFPDAKKIVMISPRSDYQTVAQELARIRSRRSNSKEAIILFYKDTAETVKAERLSIHLKRQKFNKQSLFSISNAPKKAYSLGYFDSRHQRVEESLYSDL